MAFATALLIVLQGNLENDLDVILDQLKADASDVGAQADLEKLCRRDPRHARRLLKRRIARCDGPVKDALQHALESAPVLQLRLSVEGHPRVGDPVRFRVRIKNVSDTEQIVVGAIEGSDTGARSPRYVFQVLDPDGTPVGFDPPRRPPPKARIGSHDLARLRPDDEFDPFGDWSAGHYFSGAWRPDRPGRYTVKLVCDLRFEEPPECRHDRIRKLMSRVPPVKLSATAEFHVR